MRDTEVGRFLKDLDVYDPAGFVLPPDKCHYLSRNKKQNREAHLWSKYHISHATYKKMLAEQGGVCKICGNLPNKGKVLHVDHDHVAGDIRGLLCHGCNTGLGMFKENLATLESAKQYLLDCRGAEIDKT